jgi:hypothetical protein
MKRNQQLGFDFLCVLGICGMESAASAQGPQLETVPQARHGTLEPV